MRSSSLFSQAEEHHWRLGVGGYGTVVKTKSAYDPAEESDGERILVTRYWPHGISKARLETLAKAFEPDDLAERAYALYETFRPEIARGKTGWGVKGMLDLRLTRSLAARK